MHFFLKSTRSLSLALKFARVFFLHSVISRDVTVTKCREVCCGGFYAVSAFRIINSGGTMTMQFDRQRNRLLKY